MAVDGQEGPDEASCDIADHVSGRGVTVVTIDLEPFDAQRKQACDTGGEEEWVTSRRGGVGSVEKIAQWKKEGHIRDDIEQETP